MDTDSFIFCINTNDIIEGIQNLNETINFSNLNENHKLFS